MTTSDVRSVCVCPCLEEHQHGEEECYCSKVGHPGVDGNPKHLSLWFNKEEEEEKEGGGKGGGVPLTS